jgi:hypothetical protein
MDLKLIECENVDWIPLPQNMVQWRDLVNDENFESTEGCEILDKLSDY